MESFAFWAITREPIKIQTHSASQNDCQNLGFMKDIYEYGEKVARNSSKTAIQLSQILGTTLYFTHSLRKCKNIGHFAVLLAKSNFYYWPKLEKRSKIWWAFVSSPLCLITMVGGDSSPTSSLVVVFPHLCHTSSYILLVFPHLPMKSFQYWEISL